MEVEWSTGKLGEVNKEEISITVILWNMREYVGMLEEKYQ